MTASVARRAAGLLAELSALDALLDHAVAAAHAAFGAGVENDPNRGLYIAPSDVDRLLRRRDPAPPPTRPQRIARGGVWDKLAARFELERFDLDVLLVAVAPEVDLRYERIYAYLQDDVTRRLATADLVLALLCASAEERLERRARFAASAPLVRSGLIRLVPDPNHVEPPLLAHYVKPDEGLVHLLTGQVALSPRLAEFAELVDARPPTGDDTDRDLVEGLVRIAGRARTAREPFTLHFRGPPGVGRRLTAQAVAAGLGLRLLAVDVERALDVEADLQETAKLAVREAALHDALLYIGAFDALGADDRAPAARALASALRESRAIAILAGEERRPPPAFRPALSIRLALPVRAVRADAWRAAAARAGIDLAEAEVDALATRFRVTRARIDTAAAAAADGAALRGADSRPSVADLFAAVREQSAGDLAARAVKVTPVYGWEDIVLPPERLEQLKEIGNSVRHRALVYDTWGFDAKLSLGKGLNVLFAGPSGTGKTMAAEIIARDLELDLYKIDLSTIVSKYIGETEKNLARIFADAEASNAILFFDEADALFGRRSEVRDSHDRYANIEISYLLQKMEEYQGAVILATNLRKNMDEAFVRRMHFTVDFPLPTDEDRLRIWRAIWPRELPRAPTLDLETMARRYELVGGNIRNIALAAAFLAAADGGAVTTDHLLRATRREYQKMGKVVAAGDFGTAS